MPAFSFYMGLLKMTLQNIMCARLSKFSARKYSGCCWGSEGRGDTRFNGVRPSMTKELQEGIQQCGCRNTYVLNSVLL